MAVKDSISFKEYVDQRIADNSTHFEARINNLEKNLLEREHARTDALTVATRDLERRLNDLNHAHARANEVLNTYLPREIYDKFREEDGAWKRQSEVLRATYVNQTEFRLYKESTQQALTLTSGKEEGVSSVWGAVVIIFSVLAAIGTMVTAAGVFLRH